MHLWNFSWGSTWSSQICRHQNFLYGGVVLFWSTHIHMQDRLDKPCSALAEAWLKIIQKYRCQQWIKHIFLLTYFNYVNFQYSSTHTNHWKSHNKKKFCNTSLWEDSRSTSAHRVSLNTSSNLINFWNKPYSIPSKASSCLNIIFFSSTSHAESGQFKM